MNVKYNGCIVIPSVIFNLQYTNADTIITSICTLIFQRAPYSLTIPLGAISCVEKFGSVKYSLSGYGFQIICKVSSIQ